MTPKRYCPDRPFPRYAYVPGRFPHPETDPAGHSYGRPRGVSPYREAAAWGDNPDYLYGVDLFNAGFLWEAHEAWEGVWNSAKVRDELQAVFVQGLIQVAAALLRRSMGSEGGAQSLAHDALEQLHVVEHTVGPGFMGVDLAEVLPGWAEVFANPPGSLSIPAISLGA
jgi:hypothetical protein